MTFTQRIMERVLGSTDAAAAPCEGPTYSQYSCWVTNRIPTRYVRSCYSDRCDRRTYCGSWRAYQCVSSC